MSVTRQISNQRELFGASGPEPLAATDGEINFLWSFIQGSIMIPETWNALLRNYGFCERHAWIHIAVEMSFREEYLLGPTILYSALVERSLRAVSTRRIIGPHLLTGQLRGTHRCLLCTMNLGSASVGSYPKGAVGSGTRWQPIAKLRRQVGAIMARLSLLGLLRAVQQWSASKALSPTPGRSYESGDANRYWNAKEYAANFIRSSSSLPKFLCRWAPKGKQPRSCSLDCSDRLVQRMAPIACTTFVSEATRFVSETSVTCHGSHPI